MNRQKSLRRSSICQRGVGVFLFDGEWRMGDGSTGGRRRFRCDTSEGRRDDDVFRGLVIAVFPRAASSPTRGLPEGVDELVVADKLLVLLAENALGSTQTSLRLCRLLNASFVGSNLDSS